MLISESSSEVGKPVRLESEIQEPRVRRLVVVVLSFHSWIRKVVDRCRDPKVRGCLDHQVG